MKKLQLLAVVLFTLTQAKTQNWVEVQKILASDAASYDRFGYSISISGNYIIVGAPNESEDTAGGDSIHIAGSAYVFERDGGGNWKQVSKIVASDRADWDVFGWSVAISGTYAIVGAFQEDEDATGGNTLSAAGSAYLFERDGSGQWNQVQKIVASDRASYDHFGGSVSISGNYAIFGVLGEDEDATGGNTLSAAGSAYLFERDGTGQWNEVQKIVASDRATSEFFGVSVSISGDHVIVGAYHYDDTGHWPADPGSAYIFERDGSGNWREVQKVVATNSVGDNAFGSSVSINGDHAIVGAPFQESAYLFKRNGTCQWNEQEIITYDHGVGRSLGPVSIGTDYAIAGAVGCAGVYVFESSGVGITNSNLASSSSVYPNPTTGHLTIDLGQTYGDVTATVSNLLGQTISIKPFGTTHQLCFDLAGPKGFYLIEIQTREGQSAVLKVLKD